MDRRSDKELFEAFVAATADQMVPDVNQDPSPALDAQPQRWTLRGLITRSADGPVWWPFEATPTLLRARGPEALAHDFIEGFKEARRTQPSEKVHMDLKWHVRSSGKPAYVREVGSDDQGDVEIGKNVVLRMTQDGADYEVFARVTEQLPGVRMRGVISRSNTLGARTGDSRLAVGAPIAFDESNVIRLE